MNLIDLGEESDENAFDLICADSEFISNEIDESNLQDEKHDEQRN
jgi:hypothetical protein